MSAKSARREYLEAVAEFQRGCEAFARGMGRILEPPQAQEPGELHWIAGALGSSRPPVRAPREAAKLREGDARWGKGSG